MNSRARELARRAVGRRKDDVESISLFGEQIEAFAELLIRECVSVVKSRAVEKPMSEYYITQIKQHFGVGE